MRLIIHDFDVLGPDAVLAVRAVQYLAAKPAEKRDAIVTFDAGRIEVYVVRNASGSITARMLRRKD